MVCFPIKPILENGKKLLRKEFFLPQLAPRYILVQRQNSTFFFILTKKKNFLFSITCLYWGQSAFITTSPPAHIL